MVQQKKKQNKTKQIQQLMRQENSIVNEQLQTILRICDYNLEVVADIIAEKTEQQKVKQKGKEVTLQLIKRDNFFDIIKEKTGVQISSEVQELLQPVLMLDTKYPDIFQIKLVTTLFEEAMILYKKQIDEQKRIEEFYSSPGADDPNSNALGGQQEVMNFD